MNARQRRKAKRASVGASLDGRKAAQQWVDDNIVVHMVSSQGWVHTHGLAKRGLPELEIRGVCPEFLMWEAGILLNHIAEYMVATGLSVKAGQTYQYGSGPVVLFEALPPMQDVDLPVESLPAGRLTVTSTVRQCALSNEQEESCS